MFKPAKRAAEYSPGLERSGTRGMSPNISGARVAGGGLQCHFWFWVSDVYFKTISISEQ